MPEPRVTHVEKKPAKAIRMIFAFDGEHVHLVSQQAVEMVLPPSDALHGAEGHKGFWYELRDVHDRPLYRRVMHDPMREDVEVFSDDPKHTVGRQTVPNRKGTFVVVVPDTEAGHAVTVSSSPQRLAQAHQPAKVIARFALRNK
jgi:hypothetical protein